MQTKKCIGAENRYIGGGGAGSVCMRARIKITNPVVLFIFYVVEGAAGRPVIGWSGQSRTRAAARADTEGKSIADIW